MLDLLLQLKSFQHRVLRQPLRLVNQRHQELRPQLHLVCVLVHALVVHAQAIIHSQQVRRLHEQATTRSHLVVQVHVQLACQALRVRLRALVQVHVLADLAHVQVVVHLEQASHLVVIVQLVLVVSHLAVIVQLVLVVSHLVVIVQLALAQVLVPERELLVERLVVVQVAVAQIQPVVAVTQPVHSVAQAASLPRLASQSGQSVKNGTTCRRPQWAAHRSVWVKVKSFV